MIRGRWQNRRPRCDCRRFRIRLRNCCCCYYYCCCFRLTRKMTSFRIIRMTRRIILRMIRRTKMIRRSSFLVLLKNPLLILRELPLTFLRRRPFKLRVVRVSWVVKVPLPLMSVAVILSFPRFRGLRVVPLQTLFRVLLFFISGLDESENFTVVPLQKLVIPALSGQFVKLDCRPPPRLTFWG